MKNLKKIMALVLVAVMMMAFAVTAQAGTITINSAATDTDTASDTTEYTWYQILLANIDTQATVNEETGATTTAGTASYYVTTQARATAIESTGLFTVTKDVTQDKWYVALTDDTTTAEAIATALNGIANKDTLFETGTFHQDYPNSTNVSSSDLANGYYLITSTLGDKLVVQTLGDVTINTKNTYPPVTKTVAETDKSAQIGTDVTYTLTVGIPANAAAEPIVLTDTMTEGLTFKSVDKVNNGTDDLTVTTDYEVSAVNATDNSFTITFPAATVTANKGKTLTITYKATLNEKAVVAVGSDDSDGNDNTVQLDYGNKYTSKPVTVETDTQEFKFDKVDGSTKLPGAIFEVHLSGTALNLVEVAAGETYRVATAAEIADDSVTTVTQITTTGKQITVIGVDGDLTYQLVETQAPTGYNMPDNPSTDVMPGTENTVEITVENNKGATLPSTGGIGTTIFYVIGAVFVLAAGVLLVTKRRMSAEK